MDRQTVRSVERALDVLLCFGGAGGDQGVTQIAQQLGLSKSTVHRLLLALEAKGFVSRSAEGERYRLGMKALELAAAFLKSDDLAEAAYHEMEQLRDQVGETVSLYVRDGLERVRIQKVEGRLSLRRVVHLGQRLPLYLGASGKVLLAGCDDSEQDRILAAVCPEGFDVRKLKVELQHVWKQGWAVSSEEREEGIASVSAPVLNRSGRSRAALAVSGPANRFDRATVEALAPAVIRSARTIGLLAHL
jgi:IclR family transcriptional regulator, KDG regulon repressor